MSHGCLLLFRHMRNYSAELPNESSFIDAITSIPDTPSVVDPKKNSQQSVTKAIRLKPSTTDYATFVRTTSKVLGTTGPASRKTEPSTLVLSVANAES